MFSCLILCHTPVTMSLKRDHAFYWDSCSFFQLAMSYGRTRPLHLDLSYFSLLYVGQLLILGGGENFVTAKIMTPKALLYG
jgi:hypothetical protein